MSFLSRFRRKSAPPPEVQLRGLAMVLLPANATFDADAALRIMRGSTGADGMEVMSASTEQGVTTGEIPGGAFGLVHMPVPIPAGELEWPAKVAYHWPTASEEIARHASHVIVHAGSSTRDVLDVRLFHTRLVAAVAEASGAIGVYIGSGMLVRSAADYIDDARTASRENLPLLSWVGIHPVREKSGTVSGYTTGMTDFGFLDLEVHRTDGPASAVLATLADAANYQLSTGTRLGDGETFGFSETDRRRIRHARSEFLSDTTVAILDT